MGELKMKHYTDEQLAGLIREDRVHRNVYTDPEIFDLEMERIWKKAWVYVGHDSQVKQQGDYFATSIGRQSVIMIRHSDGKVYVLFNRCSHKGAQVVGESCGNMQQLRCSYHGYVFDTDGTLIHIPREEAYGDSGFGKGKAESNMRRVPRVDSYHGLVFASLATQGPDLKTWLSGAAVSIDNLVERSPEGRIEIAGGCFRYQHDSNWKMFVENLNDAMHPMVVHQSSSGTAKRVFDERLKEGDPVPFELEMLAPFTNNHEFFEKMGLTAWNYGHSVTGGKFSIHSAYSPIPGYMDSLVEKYGEQKAREILAVNRHNTVVYPSFTLKGAITSIRVVKPVAVNKTVIESWVFRQVGAPEELFQRSITYCNLINSHANVVGPDDYEAYHRLQYGLQTQDSNEWVSQHRYLGKEEIDEDGTKQAAGTSDMVFRHQFQTWKNYMVNTQYAE
jgi:phenylpropionate dioxygenase-like ring-hydroxylating dioxygenase large terminal subunit